MDQKTLGTIGIVAVIIIAGAIGFIAWKFGDDEEPESDYALFDTLKTDGVKGGLYYITEETKAGCTFKNTVITAEETTSTDIQCVEEKDYKYKDQTGAFSVSLFKDWYFDFTDSSKTPQGVTVARCATVPTTSTVPTRSR